MLSRPIRATRAPPAVKGSASRAMLIVDALPLELQRDVAGRSSFAASGWAIGLSSRRMIGADA
jgi:hypothetical protein